MQCVCTYKDPCRNPGPATRGYPRILRYNGYIPEPVQGLQQVPVLMPELVAELELELALAAEQEQG